MPKTDFELIRVFRGGSLARTLLVRENGVTKIRKEARADGASYAFRKLQEQADWVRRHQGLPHIPRYLGEIRSGSYYAYDLEYYENLSFFDFIHRRPLSDSKEKLRSILDFCFENLYRKTLTPPQSPDVMLRTFIREKLFEKVKSASDSNPVLAQLSAHPRLFINQDGYDNFDVIARKILSDKETLARLSRLPFTDVHGDLTVENLLCTKDGFILVDPNPDNIFNTPAVDLAKLSQSLHSGYEFLVELEDCQVLENQVIFNPGLSSQYLTLGAYYRDELRGRMDDSELFSLPFFEALHYARMLPLKQAIYPKTVPVFYAVLVKLLNEFHEKH